MRLSVKAISGRNWLLLERFFCGRFDEDGYQCAGSEANLFKAQFFAFRMRAVAPRNHAALLLTAKLSVNIALRVIQLLGNE